LKIEATDFSEALLVIHGVKRHHVPYDFNLNLYRHRNLRSWLEDFKFHFILSRVPDGSHMDATVPFRPPDTE
jgi:hypothetical protein